MEKLYLSILLSIYFINPSKAQFTAIDSAQLTYDSIVSVWWSEGTASSENFIYQQVVTGENSSSLIKQHLENKVIDTLLLNEFNANSIWLEDMNNDNQLSIIGTTQNVTDGGIIIFSKVENNFISVYEYKIDSLLSIAISDWNMDGLRDIIYQKIEQGTVKLYLLINKGEYLFSPAKEILSQNKEHNFILEDLNNDQQKDLINSTKNDTIEAKTEVLFFDKAYKLTSDSTLTKNNTYSISMGDFNANGKYDLFLSYQLNEQAQNELIYQEDTTIMHLIIKEVTDKVLQSFMADFTSDGLTDIMLLVEGIKNQNKVILIENIEKNDYEIVEIVEKTQNTSMAFKDQDDDGDLDLLLWGDNKTDKWTYYENMLVDTNYGPSPSAFHSYLMIDKVPTLLWSEADDDHSTSSNITYDVAIGTLTNKSQIYSPYYNLESSSSRIKTKRGNVNFENSLLLTNITPDKYYYQIQAIDNALCVRIKPENGGTTTDCSPGIACGTFETCDSLEITFEVLEVCANTPFIISSDDEINVWYSYSDGLLGFERDLIHQLDATDTIISNTTVNPSCGTMKAYVIIPFDKDTVTIADISICTPELITVNSPIDADSVHWLTKSHVLISTAASLDYQAEKQDTLIYNAYKGSCFITDTFHIVLDTAQVAISNGELIEIVQGNSVTLNAINADSYIWYPDTYLDNTEISSPIASPINNITYKVMGFSKGRCVSEDSISIQVKKESFIPALFTPNNDGKNDKLLIYGLNPAIEFKFFIFSRQGALVFKSTDFEEMKSVGWDGTHNNNPLPTGIYYWKIQGKYQSDGSSITVEGKQEGKVHLSR